MEHLDNDTQTNDSAMSAEDVRIEDFETSLQKLQELVKRLENKDMSLAEALQCYDQASRLTITCEKQLSAVDRQVRVITERIRGV